MRPMVVGNKQPLYRQVAQTLRQRIRTGEFGKDQPLPSFRKMAQQFNVSLSVIQHAVRLLENGGVLTTHHGKAVVVDRTEPCSSAAIIFGLIQPFDTGMQMRVMHDAEKVFAQRDNFVVLRSSHGDARTERRIAEHLVANGVSGLLVWPIEQSPNGAFFNELAQQMPVVLVDRLVPGATVPAVVHAMEAGGRDICGHMLGELSRRRLVALIDDGDMSSYRDLMRGLRSEAQAMNRPDDLQIVRWPLIRLVEQFSRSDFSGVDAYTANLRTMLQTDGGPDALFCPQSDFIDVAMVQSGLMDRFPHLAVGTVATPQFNQHSRRFCESGIIQWEVRYAQAIAKAADLLQQWLFRRQRPQHGITVAVHRPAAK